MHQACMHTCQLQCPVIEPGPTQERTTTNAGSPDKWASRRTHVGVGLVILQHHKASRSLTHTPWTSAHAAALECVVWPGLLARQDKETPKVGRHAILVRASAAAAPRAAPRERHGAEPCTSPSLARAILGSLECTRPGPPALVPLVTMQPMHSTSCRRPPPSLPRAKVKERRTGQAVSAECDISDHKSTGH